MHHQVSIVDSGAVRKARTLLMGATVLWGMSFPLLRGLQLTQQPHAFHVSDRTLACADMAVRFGLGALCLLVFYARELRHVSASEWRQSLGLAVFAAGGLYFQTLGLSWTDASISAFLTQIYILIVPLIVALRDRHWPSLRLAMACALVLTGVALLSPGLLSHFILGPGEIVTMVGAVFFAMQIVWLERPAFAQNRSGVVTVLMFGMLALLFGTLYPCLGGTLPAAKYLFGRSAIWELLAVLVLFCTITSFFVMNAWQRFIPATEAGLIYCIEPVIATVLCAFLPGWISRLTGISYPNETLHWTLLIGGLLIVGATILGVTERKRS